MRTKSTFQYIMGFIHLFLVTRQQLGAMAAVLWLYGYQSVQAQTNLALGKPVFSSSTNSVTTPNSNLTDGDSTTFALTGHTNAPPSGEWFQIDLGADYYIERIVIRNRTDAGQDRGRRFMVVTYPSNLSALGASPASYVNDSRYNKLFYGDPSKLSTSETVAQTTAVKTAGQDLGPAYTVLNLNAGIHFARTVFILSLQDDAFNLAEVEVYGTRSTPVRTFVNGGFESIGPAAGGLQYVAEAMVPGWSTTEGIADVRNSLLEQFAPSPDATNGGRIELWGSGLNGVSSFEGGRHAELNAFMNGELSQQSICVLPGETFNWSLAHRGRSGVDVMRLSIDDIDVADFSDNNATAGTHTVTVLTPATTTATKGNTDANGWTQYTGTWTNRSGSAKTVQFAFQAINTATGDVGIGNFLDAVSITGLQAMVAFNKTAASGPENVPTASLPKLLVNGAVATPQTIQINISSGSTATRGSDYSTTPATGPISVTIPAGIYDGTDSTAISLTPYLQIQRDVAYPELDETIIMSLQNPSSGLVLALGGGCGMGETSSTYTINDICPVIMQLTASVSSATICSGDAVNIAYTTVPTGSEVHWTRTPGNLTGSGNVINFPTASGTTPASYTYTATVFTIGGCPSQTAVTEITVNPTPIVTPSTCSQTICSGQPGNITFATSVPNSTVHWLRVEDNVTGTGDINAALSLTGTASQTFTYRIWADSPAPASCPSSTTITSLVIVNPGLAVNALVTAGSGCIGQPLSLSATVIGTAAPVTYAWAGPNGYTGTGSNPQVTASAATTNNGSYTVTATNAQGCSGTATLPVAVSNCCSLTATAGNPVVACTGSTINLVVTAGNSTTAPVTQPLTYTWSGPNGFVANTANPTLIATVAAGGTYRVTVTDGQSCTATSDVTVSVTAQPSAGDDMLLSICNNETINLATYFPAGGSFSARSGSLTGSTFNGITSGAGSFTVAYTTGGGGCPVDEAIATVIVRDCSVPLCNYPISSAVVDATCGNSDGRATVSMGGLPADATAAFAWSNGKTGATVTGLAAGSYTMTATISTSLGTCTVTDYVQVNEIGGPIAEINLISAADCRGANGAVAINVTTGTGPFRIVWSGAATGTQNGVNLGTTTISNLAAGQYTFEITSPASSTSCSSFLSVTIPKDDSDQITLTATPTSATACGSATGSVQITATPAVGVTGPFSFSLNGVGIGNSSLPVYTINGLLAGAYTVSVSAAGGCSAANIPVTISETGAPALAGWTAVNPTCPVNQGQLVFAGGQSTATFRIREAVSGSIVGNNISGASSTTLVLPAGTYSIEGTTTGSSCKSYTALTISRPEGLEFNVQYTKVTCAPGGVPSNDGTISLVQITGGTAPYSTTVLNAQNQAVSNLQAVAPGIYTVQVHDSRGCSGVENVFVTVPDCNLQCPKVPMNTFVIDANCSAADGRAVAQLGAYAEGDVDYLWSNGFSGKNSNGLASGVYSVTGTVLTGDFVGCTYVQTVNVNQIGGPVVARGIINPSNCTASTGTVSFSVTSGTGPFTVTWSGSAGSSRTVNGTAPFQFTQTGLAPGNYVFTFRGSDSNCQSTMDVTIPVSSSSSIALTATPNAASGCGAQDGSINLTASGSGPNYSFSLNGSAYTSTAVNTTIIPNLPAGIYTVGVTSGANGCQTEQTVVVSEAGAPAISGWSSQSALCAASTGSLTYAGGSGAGTYRVLLGGTQVATTPQNATGPVVYNLPQGVYTVELINGLCTAYQNLTITGPAGIDFNVQYIAETCGPVGAGNGDGSLNVIQISGGTGSYTVSVLNSTTGQSFTGASQTALTAGTYSVSVVDANSCRGNEDALVTVPPCSLKCPPLTFNTSVVDNQCGQTNGRATAQLLNVPGGATATYAWSNGQNGALTSGLTAGVYSVTATLLADNTIYAGCAYVDTINVNDIGGPVVSVSATAGASCTAANGSVALTIQGGTGAYTLAWTGTTSGSQNVTSAGLVNVPGLKAGTYVFTVTGSNSSCQSVIDVIVPTRTPNGFTLAATPAPVSGCGASDGRLTMVVSGGTGPFTYIVNGFVKGVSITRTFSVRGLPAGVYKVDVMDGNGCTVSQGNVLINSTGQSAIANWTSTRPTCPATNGTLQYSGSGNATDAYVVTLSGSATEIGRTTGNAAASYSVPGGTYLITRTTSTSCVSVTTVTIAQPDGLDFNVQYGQPNCSAPNSGSLAVVQATGGTAPLSYTVTGTTGVVTNLNALSAGSYTITTGDASGCTLSQSLTLTTGSTLTAVVASVASPTACMGSAISLSATTTGGTAPLTYAWSGPDSFTSTSPSTSAVASVSGSYMVSVTDASGCSATASTGLVTVSNCAICTKPVLTLGDPECNTATGGYTVSVTTNGVLTLSSGATLNGNTIVVAANTNLVVSALSSNTACDLMTSKTVLAPTSCTTGTPCTLPKVTVGNGVCQGSTYTVSLVNTSGATITATAGVVGSTAITAIPVGTSVTITATSAPGCSFSTVVASPASCTAACSESPVSLGGVVCNNGLNYTIVYTLTAGVSVSASAGTVTATGVTGIPLTTAVVLTIAGSTPACPIQSLTVAPPANCTTCNAPLLTMGAPVCDIATGTYSVSFNTNGIPSSSAGVVSGSSVTGIPVGTDMTLTATRSGCEFTSSLTAVSPVSCSAVTCPNPPVLKVGQPICNTVTGGYTVAFNSDAVVTVLGNGGSISGNTLTVASATNVTLVAANTAGCSTRIAVGTPTSCSIACARPALSVGGAICANATSYSVTYTATAGASVTATAGVVTASAVTGIPTGVSVVITVTDACGTQSLPVPAPTNCNLCNTTVTAGATNPVVCLGGTISLTATVAGGTAPYTYAWSGPDTFTATGASPVIPGATSASNGSYSVVVTDANACSVTATTPVAVTVGAAPNAGADAIVSICNTETVDLATYFPAGGTFRSATTGNALTGSTFNGLVAKAGTFLVQYVVAANGCPGDTAVATLVVRNCAPQPPCNFPLSTAVIDANCGSSDGNVQVTLGGLLAGATAGYAWSNGATGPQVNGLLAGVYSVTATVTSAGVYNGCTVVDSIQVNEIGGPVMVTQSILPADCRGNNGVVTLNITSGTGPFAIRYTGPVSGTLSAAGLGNNPVTNLPAGSYTFKINSVGNAACSGYLAVTVPRNDAARIALTVTPTNATACATASGSIVYAVTPQAGTAVPFTYLLNGQVVGSSSLPSFTLNNVVAGVYTASVRSNEGCATAELPVVIKAQSASAIVGWTASDAKCQVNSGALVFAGGQAGTVSYRVTSLTNGATVATVSGSTATTLVAAAGKYVVSQTSSTGCLSTDTLTIKAPAGLDFNVQYTAATCGPGGASQSDGTIHVVQITGGTAPHTVRVSGNANEPVANTTTLAPGNYSVQVLDVLGCNGVQQVLITIPACKQQCPKLPMNIVVVDAQCGSANGQATATLLGTPAGSTVTYLWSNGQNGPTLTGLASGIYSVTATVTSSGSIYNTCTYGDTITVSDISGPIASLQATSPASCTNANGSVVLSITNGTAPYRIAWSGAATGTQNALNAGLVSIAGLPAGGYVFQVTSGTLTCQSVLNVTVPQSSTGVIQLAATTNNASSCGASNGSINATVSGGTAPFVYSINGYALLTTTSRTVTLPGFPAGTYTVSVTDASSCGQVQQNVLINENAQPPITGWTGTNAACASTNGVITYAGNGSATDQYTVRISGTSTLVGQTPGNTALTLNVPGGTYQITRTTATSCVSVTTITVTQPVGLDVHIQYTQPTCQSLTSGQLSTIQISGGTAPYLTTVTSITGAVSSLTALTAGSYTVTVGDANSCLVSQVVSLTTGACASCFTAAVYLQGALVNGVGVWPTNPVTGKNGEPLMRDDLRTADLIPLSDPYRQAPYNTTFTHVANPYSETIVNPTVALAERGDSSVVDWVFLEFRDPATPSVVSYTRSALVLRNGAIVDVDGKSCLRISHITPGAYYVAVRHRNHLGVMTQTTRLLNTAGTDLTVDFRRLTPAQIWHDTSDPDITSLYGDVERRNISWAPGYYALWGGNANRDKQTIFQGENNDPVEGFNQVISSAGNSLNLSSFILSGYYSGDVDMNGQTIFQGESNEPAIIYNIMIQHPKNLLNNPAFLIQQQLP